jgi:hypothetical protein
MRGRLSTCPDARCERSVTHELAFTCLEGGVEQVKLQALNAGYQNPPLLVEVQAADGGKTSILRHHTGAKHQPYLREDLPLSSLHIHSGKALARLFNPNGHSVALSRFYQETDVFGEALGIVDQVAPKRIITIEVPRQPVAKGGAVPAEVRVLNPPAWRIGPNRGTPDLAVMEQFKTSIERLGVDVADATARAGEAEGREAYHWQHLAYVLGRELLEMRLSLRLNEIKLDMGGKVTEAYLYEPDEQVAAIGYELNQMRIRRRIYDYVMAMTGKH